MKASKAVGKLPLKTHFCKEDIQPTRTCKVFLNSVTDSSGYMMPLTNFILCIKTKMLQGVVLSPGRFLFALRTFKIIEVAQLLLGNSSVTQQAGGEKSNSKSKETQGMR